MSSKTEPEHSVMKASRLWNSMKVVFADSSVKNPLPPIVLPSSGRFYLHPKFIKWTQLQSLWKMNRSKERILRLSGMVMVMGMGHFSEFYHAFFLNT
jgi:hypothetical protein